MPFKIYTYEDPYKLDKADFWSEISALPHFCSARTLVNGLKDVLGDSIKGLICPLDELVQQIRCSVGPRLEHATGVERVISDDIVLAVLPLLEHVLHGELGAWVGGDDGRQFQALQVHIICLVDVGKASRILP